MATQGSLDHAAWSSQRCGVLGDGPEAEGGSQGAGEPPGGPVGPKPLAGENLHFRGTVTAEAEGSQNSVHWVLPRWVSPDEWHQGPEAAV